MKHFIFIGVLFFGCPLARAADSPPAKKVTEFGAFIANKNDPATITA